MQECGGEPNDSYERRLAATVGRGFRRGMQLPLASPNVAHWVGWFMAPKGTMSQRRPEAFVAQSST